MPRLFFAIPIPAELRKKLLGSFPDKNFHGIRFTPDENLHITVHFLGSTEEEKVNEIVQSAATITYGAVPFELQFEKVKLIAKERKPVMIWVQFEENVAFEKLTLKLREAFPTDEKRKPNPHATLARIRQVKRLPFDFPEIKPFSFIADRLELWESKLHSDGSKYQMLHGWKLNS